MKTSELFKFDYNNRQLLTSLSKIKKFDFEDGPTGLGGIKLSIPEFSIPITWLVTDVEYKKDSVVSWELTIDPNSDAAIARQFSSWKMLIINN